MSNKRISRALSLALLCALLSQLCGAALAAGETDTVYLSDEDDLRAFAENCAYDAWSEGKTVILQRDIALGGVDFLPIASFGGTFEGGGHTISGLNVSSSVSPAGLFGTVAATGVVNDLSVEGSVAPGGSADAAGGVAGVNRGTIAGCSFVGTVSGEKRIGGIAGENAATGTIRRCVTSGGVFGKNMTGGVAGVNHGTVSFSTNRAYVNTNTIDPSVSFDKLDLSLSSGLDSLMSPDTYNVTVDSGGVAGFSDGALLGCHNYGSVGYQHIGYNVGGIAGRSSGHIATSANDGRVYGRREVGGVVGMAEPYVKLNLKESSIEQVRRELNELSRLIDHTVDDAESGSATISARLTEINRGVDEAETRAQTLTDGLVSYWDGTVAEVDRGSEILANTIEQLAGVTDDLVTTSETTTKALNDLERALGDLNGGPGGNVFDELAAAAADVRRTADILNAGTEEMKTGLSTISSALEEAADNILALDRAKVSQGVDELRGGLEVLTDGRGGTSGDAGGASYYLNSSMTHIKNVMVSAEAASKDLQSAVGYLSDASGELTVALRDAEKLLNYLDNQQRLNFSQLGTQTDTDADALYDSLRGISNNIELLNQETRSATDVVLEDVRQINRQFTALMNTLLDVVEDVEGTSTTTVVEDTSDEDIDAAVEGKVLLCSNAGEVSGDIDVGGVAGAMMIYNELDPENDDDTISSAFHKRYELKCILQECVNSGAVSGKKDDIGSVCGSATLGVISGCEGYGSAESEGGDNVGGVAGYADNIVRKCWAKCALAGLTRIGGIVGSGKEERSNLRVEGCRALVQIAEGGQYTGSVLGADTGYLADNLFVSDTLAGVNRVSERGRAEPVTYEQLLAEGGTPQEFRRFTLRFVADGETIREVRFDYGDSFDDTAFPEIPPVAGKFARWDQTELRNLRFDTTVNAVYEPCVTALGSDITRSASRPAFFAEGAFDRDDVMEASPAIFDFDDGQDGFWSRLRSYRRTLLEQWQLAIPDDGSPEHVVRYLPPEGVSDKLELYTLDGNGWTRLETGKAGSYLTFVTGSGETELTVISTATPWWVWALVDVFVLVAAALLAVLLIRKKPRRELSDEEKAKAAASRKKKRTIRVILIAAALALGAAVGAVVMLAPGLTDSMGLYMLLRNYAERTDLDMTLSLSAHLDGETFDTNVDYYTTACGEKRVSCVMWQDIPLYYCDGVMLLENGKAYRADDVLPDYGGLLTHAAALYRTMDVAVSEENGVETYRAAAQGEAAERLLAALLPRDAGTIPETESVELELVLTDGEPTSLRFLWDGEAGDAEAELHRLAEERDHTLPQAVRTAINSGEYAQAEEIGDDVRRLLTAWTELATRDPLTADAALTANCGPLLLDEKLTWQRTDWNGTELSCVIRRGTTLYYTGDAACTANGFAVGMGADSLTGTAELLHLAYRALLLGEPTCTATSGGWRYAVTLDEAAMSEFAAAIAAETETMGVSFGEGQIRLDLTDGDVAAISVQCEGAVRVVRTDVPASFGAQLAFRRDEGFPAPAPRVLSALGLE